MNGNDRSIVGLVAVAHAMVHTYELSIPILVTVWLGEFGVTEATIGLVVTVGYGLFGLGALPGGILADRFGSRRLIAACLLGMGGSFLVLSAAPGVGVVALALLVWGVAASVYHPSGLRLISTGVDDRGSAFAYHGMAGNLGIALGPLATTLLLLAFDWRTVTALLAAPAAVAAAFALRADVDETAAVEADGGTTADGAADEPDGEDDSRAAGVESFAAFRAGTVRLFTGAFLGVFVVVVCSGLYYRGVLTFLPAVLGDLEGFAPVEAAGTTFDPARYVYVGLLTVGMAGQYAGGKLTDRVRPERGIAAAFGALALLALAFLPAAALGVAPFLLVCGLLGVALFFVQPLYQATVAEYTPAGTRGLSYGYTYLGVFGVGALGGAIAGAVLSYATPATLFALLAGIATVAAAVGAVLARRDAPGEQQRAE